MIDLKVLGLDIGGANTKIAFARAEAGFLEEIRTDSEYFPMWKYSNSLDTLLTRLADKVGEGDSFEAVGVTMTAELADAYRTKQEGVSHILSQVQRAFSQEPIYVLDVTGNLKDLKHAKAKPLEFAAANWVATGWLVSQIVKNCVVVDVGSTSTSIIPIVNGLVSVAGKTDLEKLINGELVYTGSLRTNVAAIVNCVPVKGSLSRVSSELFATSGDVHLILRNITSNEFTVETADGKGKSRSDALARIARVICGDVEMLEEAELVRIAKHVYDKQVDQIAEGLIQVSEPILRKVKKSMPVIVTGIGKDFLAKKAAEKVGFKTIIDLNNLIPGNAAKVSTAVGVALMLASKIGGRTVQWKQ